MLQATQIESVQSAEVYFLPQTQLAKAKALLIEIQQLNRQTLDLNSLRKYHQKLEQAINNLPPRVHGQHILPELKSYRLALVCSIERLQPSHP
jgi:hypothetical protein